MTLRHLDPFVDRTEGLDERVNPYVARLRAGSPQADGKDALPVLHGPALRDCVGNWRDSFPAGGPYRDLVLEIGCHKGRTLVEMAHDHPETGFIGIDLTFKRVVMTAEKGRRRKLPNMVSVLANARKAEELFAAGELSGVVIFFPDPWNKKERQAKNRLMSPEFCATLERLVAPGGFIWFKTDQSAYAHETQTWLKQAGFQPSKSAEPPLGQPYVTTFEDRFARQGRVSHESRWVKPWG